MEQDQPTSRAEQRLAAVAKLKRAASLPRMKDGRRPPMHADAVSEGEKAQAAEKGNDDTTAPTELDRVVKDIIVPNSEPENKAGAQTPIDLKPGMEQESEIEQVDGTTSPGPTNRIRRRSRSRSRSRGSKDLRGKQKVAQTPVFSQTAGDSSQDEASHPPPLNVASLAPIMSPVPAHILEMQRSLLLRSPTPTSAESPALWSNNSFSPNPVILPTLEAWQRGLLRSNSAGGANAAGRMMAMHKLTGGTETYDPSGSPSSQGSNLGKLSRNNTVTGGERVAARQLMLSRLGGRIGKEAEEQVSGEEPSESLPVTKRRRRRSRRTSQSAGAVSDSDFLSTSPSTPSGPTALSPTPDPQVNGSLGSRSTTPFQPPLSLSRNIDDPTELVRSPESGRPEPLRRRSVVVEEDEEDHYPLAQLRPVLPATSSNFHIPSSRDISSNSSSDSVTQPTTITPGYPNVRTPQSSENGVSAQTISTKVDLTYSTRDDDEEQVLYQPDTYHARALYEDNFDREISWIAEPVPELQPRMPVHDEEDEDPDSSDMFQDDYHPASPHMSNDMLLSAREARDHSSPRASSSKSLVVESENSPVVSPSNLSTAPSAAAQSQNASIRTNDGSISPLTYPIRLSVASRSPLYADFPDWDERGGNSDNVKRSGDSPSAWDKVLGVLSRGSSSGRRSRSNSIVNRGDRRERADSFNRESGASLNSSKNERTDIVTQQSQPLNMQQSSSASASISSFALHSASRGETSPIPPLTPANKSKYQHAKLFPIGMTSTSEDQRIKIPSASASSPDIIMQSSSNEEDLPPLSTTISNSALHFLETGREHTLPHQASDPHLATRANPSAPTVTPDVPRASSQSNSTSKLPMNLPGVKQWLKNKKKLYSTPSTPPSTTSTPMAHTRPLPALNKPVATDVMQKKENDSKGADWEDVGNTPTNSVAEGPIHISDMLKGTNPPHPTTTDFEKTLKGKKIIEQPSYSHDTAFFDVSPLSPPSRPDPFSSTTPDLSSSLSDYPAHSISESSSTSSSRYSLGPVGAQGPLYIEKIEEELSRPRGRIWSTYIDDPPRKFLLATPVFQVVDHNTLKDRFLFLFSDILIVAKPVFLDRDPFADKSPIGRKFLVKSVVLLSRMCFTDGRSETHIKEMNGFKIRNRLLSTFVQNFSKDPDSAINTLCTKVGREEIPAAVGHLLFKTLDIDRVRLGDYLTRRTNKAVLKAFLDSFEFLGLRVDQALRVFLLSIHITERSPHSCHNREYLLEAFASRWYEANAKLVDWNKDEAHRFVRAIVQLNDQLHGGVSAEVDDNIVPSPAGTSDDFILAYRRYDQKSSVSDALLREVYKSILKERLSHHSSTGALIPIVVKRPIPSSLTWRIESEPVVLRIPHPDPGLSIELYSHDLIFDPPILNFGKSPEASFRIRASTLGPKSIIMRRAGINAVKYTGLPLSCLILVERAFMRYTLQIAFENHHGLKRRYMFSMDDSVLRYQWAAHLRRQMEATTEGLKQETSEFKRAADLVAFKVLQETLTGSSLLSVSQRNNLNSGTRFSYDRGAGGSNTWQSAPRHVRSKSRSKVYHQLGAGKNEFDSSYSVQASEDRDSRGDTEHSDGPLWTAEEIQMLCEQNSNIPSVVLHLHTLPPGQSDPFSPQSPAQASS